MTATGRAPIGHDVAHDAADAGGRALVGLDVARVVVALGLERHRPALADVDDAGVLADAGEQLATAGLGRQVAEPAQVHLARLVRAVLAPHDGVHRQLAAGRTTVQDVPNPLVLIGFQSQRRPRLLDVGTLGRRLDGVGHVGNHRSRRQPAPARTRA